MKLGLKRDEVKVVEYTPEWNDEFGRVKNDILQNVNMDKSRIEHIGSTAIKGMSAKPILDLIVGVDDIENVEDAVFDGLKKAGFLRLKVDRPKEIVLAKFTDKTYEEKTHFIHLVDFQQELWNNLIFFRDYLNSNEQARKEYAEIKCAYLENRSTGINEYTEYKEAFVKKIVNRKYS
ncbi:GrpB family protein [Jeotgalibacillus campisalis]|uniref:Dephospho-CoA kinase n=1 Tax=Jeotgalibacillus campisalis TaxID=220754 RepID=A0A0C2QYY5_9BACL|nr:GrpB family protein [Jeotgalibacillus campisalis]KIL43265.1 hypothetical protein KR50_36680 [Jeotgalibacillus campisalis]